MAYYGTSFDRHVLSSSDWVNNNYFSMRGTGRFNSMLPPFIMLDIYASCLAINFLIFHLDAIFHLHSTAFAELPAMVKKFT
jgi:hypothetical protein